MSAFVTQHKRHFTRISPFTESQSLAKKYSRPRDLRQDLPNSNVTKLWDQYIENKGSEAAYSLDFCQKYDDGFPPAVHFAPRVTSPLPHALCPKPQSVLSRRVHSLHLHQGFCPETNLNESLTWF